jgi:hypothetical protein
MRALSDRNKAMLGIFPVTPVFALRFHAALQDHLPAIA